MAFIVDTILENIVKKNEEGKVRETVIKLLTMGIFDC